MPGLNVSIRESKISLSIGKNKTLARWLKDIRNWGFIEKVELNPEVKSLAV